MVVFVRGRLVVVLMVIVVLMVVIVMLVVVLAMVACWWYCCHVAMGDVAPAFGVSERRGTRHDN